MKKSIRFIELSHDIHDRMPTYPGLPRPKITAYLSHEESRPRYEGKAEFWISRIEMVGNTATYLDSPFHPFPDAPDLNQIPLERVAGLEGVVLDATADEWGAKPTGGTLPFIGTRRPDGGRRREARWS